MKLMKITLLVGALGLLAAPAYSAAKLDITGNSIATGPSGGTLVTSFKEVGLGSSQNVSITLSATQEATWVCVNTNYKCIADGKKTKMAPVTLATSNIFTSTKNGALSSTLTLSPPNANLACAAGQKLVLGAISWTGITVTDSTNQVSSAATSAAQSVNCGVTP